MFQKGNMGEGGDVSAHMLKITTFLSLVVFLFSGKILTEPKMTVGGEYLTPSPAMVSELATSSSTTAEWPRIWIWRRVGTAPRWPEVRSRSAIRTPKSRSSCSSALAEEVTQGWGIKLRENAHFCIDFIPILAYTRRFAYPIPGLGRNNRFILKCVNCKWMNYDFNPII